MPVLRQVAEDITPEYEGLTKLIADMRETLEKSGGIGLAAPQIGLPIRVVIMDLDLLSEDYPEYSDFRPVYINAHIIEGSEELQSGDEGCLSLPGISEPVKRHKRIHVRYMDEQFVEHDEWVDGYLAVVMQHEFDHLEGKMFIDHLTGLRKTIIKNKLSALLKGKYSCSYKTKSKR